MLRERFAVGLLDTPRYGTKINFEAVSCPLCDGVPPSAPPRKKRRSGLNFAFLLVASFAAIVVVFWKNVAVDAARSSSTAKTTPQASESSRPDATGSVRPHQRSASSAKVHIAQSQAHLPDSCNGDQKCLLAWYNEYKPAILDEFVFWRTFENDVAETNSNGAYADFNYAGSMAQYKHLYWAFYRDHLIYGVSPKDLSVLVSDCRNAITDIKFMLLPVMNGKPAADVPAYLERAEKCERQFKLPKFQSQLRAHEFPHVAQLQKAGIPSSPERRTGESAERGSHARAEGAIRIHIPILEARFWRRLARQARLIF
jgi:hypothetical protein